jgi:hypothetical protein
MTAIFSPYSPSRISVVAEIAASSASVVIGGPSGGWWTGES